MKDGHQTLLYFLNFLLMKCVLLSETSLCRGPMPERGHLYPYPERDLLRMHLL